MQETTRFTRLQLLSSALFAGLLSCGYAVPANAQASAGESSGASAVLARVKSSGVLRIGIEGTYAPFDYLGTNNQYTGLDVDLAREIARRLGVKPEFVATEWSGLVGGLKADKFDMIMADMTITAERAKSVDFTIPYNASGAVLIARNGDDRYKRLSDLKGANVGTGTGTTFEKLARSVSGDNVRTYPGFNDYVQDLMNKRLDVIINDRLSAEYAIKKRNLPLHVTSDLLSVEPIGIAVKKGNATLVEELDRAISAMIFDGTYEKIYHKWFDGTPGLEIYASHKLSVE